MTPSAEGGFRHRQCLAVDPTGQSEEGHLSFPKIRSGRIRAVRENQTIIQCDVCDHLLLGTVIADLLKSAPA
jgi:hypothetical protein